VAYITITDSCQNYRRIIKVDDVITQDNWVFVYSGCLVIRTRLGRDYWLPDSVLITPADTIYWPPGDTVVVPAVYRTFMRHYNVPDTLEFDASACGGSCLAPRVVPILCDDTLWVEKPVNDTLTVCDTLCTWKAQVWVDTAYYSFTAAQMQMLKVYAGDSACVTPHADAVCFRPLSGTTNWGVPLKEFDRTFVHRCGTCPGACCIPTSIVLAWASTQPPGSFTLISFNGLMEVDEPIPCTATAEGMYGFQRTVTNCRDSIVTRLRWVATVTSTHIDDSLMLVDTCGCKKWEIKCEPGGTRDSLVLKPVIEVVGTPTTETVCDTCRTDYLIPATYEVSVRPCDDWAQICIDADDFDVMARSQPGGKLWAPGRIAIPWRYPPSPGPMRICFFPCHLPPTTEADSIVGMEYAWIEIGWFEANYPCVECGCDLIVTSTITVTGSCRKEQDTLVAPCVYIDPRTGTVVTSTTSYIYDVPSLIDSITCRLDTTGWTWTSDTIRWDTLRYTITDPHTFRLVWSDTCAPCEGFFLETVNGVRGPCGTFAIRNDCPTGTQPYWDGNTLVLNYSCSSIAPAEEGEWMTAAQTYAMVIPLLNRMDSLEARIAALEAAGGGVTLGVLTDSLNIIRGQLSVLKITDTQLKDSLRLHTVRINQLVDSIAALRAELDAIVTGGAGPDCSAVELDSGGSYLIGTVTTEPVHVSMSRRSTDDAPEALRWEWTSGVGLTLYGPPDAMITFCIFYP